MTEACIDSKVGLFCLDYEKGWMTTEAAEKFEREHLSKCNYCAESVEFMQTVYQMVLENPRVRTACEASLERTRSRQWFYIPKPVFAALAAAFVFVMIGIPVFRHYSGQNLSSQYAALAVLGLPSDEESYLRYNGDRAVDLFNEGKEALAQSNYLKAAERFTGALQLHPQNPTYQFYLGVSYALSGQYNEAIPPLQASSLQAKGSLQQDARLYLAKTYLKVGKIEEAQRALEAIMAAGDEHKADAELLLQKMRELRGGR